MLCAPPALAEGIPSQQYQERRAVARKALGDAVLVLFGRTTAETDDYRTGFRQEANFAYLTGWREPGAVLLLTPESETFFLPPHNPNVERYTGPRLAAEDPGASAATGFERNLPLMRFEAELAKALEAHTRIYALPAATPQLRSLARLREIDDADALLARQRALKSPQEIELIRRSTAVSVAAHRALWRRAAPGVFEYQLAATFTSALMEAGCERNAFAPVVASGPNALKLHYSDNARRVEPGDLILVDAGAECSGYASDITRTVPANGKFTARQKEVYEAVLGAQKAVLDALKPGVTMKALRDVATKYLDDHDKLGKYLTHGVSHDVGLEVHDAPGSFATQPLEPGMIVTVEPGVYIPEEKLGVRIEDVALVTADGAEVLSRSLPKEPGALEKAMAVR
jgi:Xaa-Pro aminopeptidase